MLKTKLNPVELKAIRLTLGLDVAEASKICGVSKRTFQYYESGGRNIPDDVVETFLHFAHTYSLVHRIMGEDIQAINDAYKAEHPLPVTDDKDEYIRLMKLRPKRPKINLPYFRTLEEFTDSTCNPYLFSHAIYQSAINHYLTIGWIDSLTDGGEIPSELKQIKFWVRGGYDDVDFTKGETLEDYSDDEL